MDGQQAFLRELEAVDVHYDSVWDLVNTRRDYAAAIPVIVDWLHRADSDIPPSERPRFKEALVRALAVRRARQPFVVSALIAEFRRPDADLMYRWAVANSLEVVCDDSALPEISELACDQRYGLARQMLVSALGRMRSASVVPLLIGLLDDPDVIGHAVVALGKLKASSARPALLKLVHHPEPWIRRAVEKSLAEIGE